MLKHIQDLLQLVFKSVNLYQTSQTWKHTQLSNIASSNATCLFQATSTRNYSKGIDEYTPRSVEVRAFKEQDAEDAAAAVPVHTHPGWRRRA